MKVGFLGLGTMGTPMALNLVRKFPLTVWNRSPTKCTLLKQAGAAIGERPVQVVEQSDVIFSMLFDESALSSVLDDGFRTALRGKTLVNTSSVSVDFSHYLHGYVQRAGGDFIEMPVSGSKVPAEEGRLVGMVAGNQRVAERLNPVLSSITAAAVYCGAIGSGLKTKYAVNLYLVTMTTGLAEAMNLARAQNLDLKAFGDVLNAGSLASAYSNMKIGKMIDRDWTTQAGIRDCYNSTRLIRAAAETAHARTPLMDVCSALYKQANYCGLAKEDMIAIIKVLE